MAVKKFISEYVKNKTELSSERKEAIAPLMSAIRNSLDTSEKAIVQFICTHNSRRSQAAEFLLDVFAREYGLNIVALSAGTEATAFNYRMIEAIKSYGFDLNIYGDDRNPLIVYGIENNDLYYYSKKYDEEVIPIGGRIVVTVCGDAEENCPIIPGTSQRLHLGYIDPKHADNSADEEETYRAKVKEIGEEMLYLVQQLAQISNA